MKIFSMKISTDFYIGLWFIISIFSLESQNYFLIKQGVYQIDLTFISLEVTHCLSWGHWFERSSSVISRKNAMVVWGFD